MTNKHKIQAFTLSEMIVVIILTSLVVGMAFSVLSLVQKHMYDIQANFNKNIKLNTLEQVFWLDFNRYSNIRYDVINNELMFASGIDTTTYKFTREFIIKEQDTFNIPAENKTFFFDGNEVISGQIDAIKLETSKSFQKQILFVFKQNDAVIYLNNQEASHN